jgi:hypothetical protein
MTRNIGEGLNVARSRNVQLPNDDFGLLGRTDHRKVEHDGIAQSLLIELVGDKERQYPKQDGKRMYERGEHELRRINTMKHCQIF